MNRLRSIKCTYVVVLFGISCLCHVIGVHVKASTDLNSLHINDSQLFKPQPLGNDVDNSGLDQNTPQKSQPHSCCRNKTINKSNSIARYSEESTSRHLVPRIPQGPNKSDELQLETAKFITAEKHIPRREGAITRHEVTKDDAAILSNSNEIINQLQSNYTQQEKKATNLEIISNFANPLVEYINYTVGGDDAEKFSTSGAFSRPPIGITNQSKFIQSDLSQQNTSNKNDIRNSTLSENISPPHKSEVELTSKNIHIPEEDKSLVKPNSTEYSEAINTQTDDDDGKGKFWTRLPLLRDTFKYLVTDFYPEKILNSLSNRFGYSNQTKTSDGVKPSVVYPLVMEGVSVLLNRFLENGDSESTEGSQGAIRGRIANTMTESIGELLRNNIVESGTVNQDESGKSSADDEDFSGLDLETVKSLLPLIQTAQSNGDLSDVMSKILKNPSHEFGDLNNLLKNYSPQLTGILSNRKVLEVIAKQRLDQSNAVNLTSIMEQFIPNNGEVGEDGMSPKNPLLRSEFVSKILAKSPVAHLGALDDSIKRLVTSSLERAVSRVKIDQNGQIHMSDGMKKMVNKMLENSDSTTTGSSAMDSINGVLRAIVQSSPEPVNATEETPKGRRNVTHHSHLHRRFMEKYGKDPRVRNSSPINHHRLSIVPLVIPLTLWTLQTL